MSEDAAEPSGDDILVEPTEPPEEEEAEVKC
jgi:hypothetical protein